MRVWHVLALLAVLLVHPVASAAEPEALADAAALRELDRAARSLAGKGRAGEVQELLDIVTTLAPDYADLSKLKAACAKRLGKTKPKRLPLRTDGDAVARCAATLAGRLDAVPDAARKPLATAVLQLDSGVTAAHEVLGHVQRGDVWVPTELLDALARRLEIQLAVQRVRQLEVPITVRESDVAVLANVYGKKGLAARSGKIEIAAVDIAEHKLRRLVREVVRTMALSEYLRGGDLAVPQLVYESRYVLFDSVPHARRAVDDSRDNGGIDDKSHERLRKRQSPSYRDGRGYFVIGPAMEGQLAAILTYYTLDWQLYGKRIKRPQACLEVGHLYWLCASYLGTGPLDVAFTETTEKRKGRSTIGSVVDVERTSMVRLAEAGMAGTRAWMRYLAQRREDPPWSRSFVDQVGKVNGDDRLKSAMVVDYLQELGKLGAVFDATSGKASKAPSFADALGTTIADFESGWRRWLLSAEGVPEGMAQRLRAARKANELTPDQKAALGYLSALRKKAVGKDATPVELDPDLATGCRAHARYLGLHPEQAKAWPDAHEEWPDAEGFSTEGNRAGGASVIVSGCSSAREAIDGWMGTFYHRLSLLDPGLVRIGWGLESEVAVLDAGSMVRATALPEVVVWPHDGARKVPARFRPELPNPVPGEDQSKWGYPVTVQFFGFGDSVRVRSFELLQGGRRVACHFSSPESPTNIRLAPRDAYVLIPKVQLAPGKYEARVEYESAGKEHSLKWSFASGP